MPRKSNKLFATLGVLGLAAGVLAILDKATDGAFSSADEANSTRDQSPQQALARGANIGGADRAPQDMQKTYRADQVMVAAANGATLQYIADAYGVDVLRPAAAATARSASRKDLPPTTSSHPWSATATLAPRCPTASSAAQAQAPAHARASSLAKPVAPWSTSGTWT